MKAKYQMRANHLDSSLININKDEVLRYLQYKSKDVDQGTQRLLEESISEIKELSELRYVYRIFNLDKDGTSINLENEILIESKDLTKLLKDSDKVAVLASTLGLAVENRIRYYSKSNLSKAVIFDSCATACIEALCDYVEEEIKGIAKEDNCGITFRYSPGYGDVPISHQKDILRSLDAARLIGLTASDTSILLPRKSVTAFIGFDKSNKVKSFANSCQTCSISMTCSFSKKGGKCGK
ncbi:MAG: methionine synthase [Clostridiales bacterium]|nr:methionine synthase [Clostridiales bacterium]